MWKTLCLSGDDQAEISQLKQRIDEFEFKDLENLKYFLGMEMVKPELENIFMSQKKYTIDLLTEKDTLGCCPFDTLIELAIN